MGIFDTDSTLFTVYGAQIILRDKLIGGIPKNPKIIEGWLASKAGIDQKEELRAMTLRTLKEIGAEEPDTSSDDALEQTMKRIAGEKQTCGFKRLPVPVLGSDGAPRTDEHGVPTVVHTGGLYYETRCLKAGLRESTNILFAGERWGSTKKGPRSFLAERAFVRPPRAVFNQVGPDALPLGRSEPDGIELFIGHVSGPKGPQSNLTYYEYVQLAVIDFEVWVVKDEVGADAWPQIWLHMQENGIGALRSQGFGTFDITRWDKLADAHADAQLTQRIVDMRVLREAEDAAKAANRKRPAAAALPIDQDDAAAAAYRRDVITDFGRDPLPVGVR